MKHLAVLVRSIAALLAAGLLLARVQAEDALGGDAVPSAPSPAVVAPMSNPEVDSQLIAELSSPEFLRRERASVQLQAQGAAAIGPLRQALPGMSCEAASRAAEVFDQLRRSRDKAVSRAARDALQEMADSDERPVAAAGRNVLDRQVQLPAEARAALISRKLAPGGFPGFFRRPVPQAPLVGLNGPGGGRREQFHCSIRNGERKLLLRDGDMTAEIEDSSGRLIHMRVTRMVNGTPETKEYSGEDRDDLARREPAAAEIYDQLDQRAGRLGSEIPPEPTGAAPEN